MKAESETNARLKEARKTLATALAVLEKIDRGEAGFLSFARVLRRRPLFRWLFLFGGALQSGAASFRRAALDR